MAFAGAATVYGVRGNIYNRTIFKYANGVYTTVYKLDRYYSSPTYGFDYFTFSARVVADSKGNVYFGYNRDYGLNDWGNNPNPDFAGIMKITPDGIVTTYAGNFGPTGLGHQDGNVASAKFYSINDLAIDQNDNIYLADHIYVRKITPAGIVSTIAETGKTYSLAADKLGNVYVGGQYIDTATNSYKEGINKISPSGAKTVLTNVAYVESQQPLITDKYNNLWVGTGNNLKVYNPSGTSLGNYAIPTYCYSTTFDKSGNTYFIRGSAINQYLIEY
ncbi:MAG: hypothetical protein EOO89_16240 [Pedobacter sp.]|nr:MAG: hypothetical protein EOO89_16240 [Pedobacter sp.]